MHRLDMRQRKMTMLRHRIRQTVVDFIDASISSLSLKSTFYREIFSVYAYHHVTCQFCPRKRLWLAETVALPQHACFAMLLCLLNAVGRGYSLRNGRKHTKYNEGINYFCEVRVHRILMSCLQIDSKMHAKSFDTKADGVLWRQIIRFSGQSWVPKTGVSSLSMSSLKKIYYLL